MVRDIIRNLRKDLTVELRSRAALSLTMSFALICTLSVSLTAGGGRFTPQVNAILLWIIIFFSAMSGLAHIFLREEDERTVLFLRTVSPPEAVFISKAIFNILFFTAVVSLVLPLFMFFLQVKVKDPALLVMCLYGGSTALASATSLLGAMASRAGGRTSLFTVISFPVILPVMWVAVGTTRCAMEGTSPGGHPVFFFLAFSGVILSVSILLFPHLWNSE